MTDAVFAAIIGSMISVFGTAAIMLTYQYRKDTIVLSLKAVKILNKIQKGYYLGVRGLHPITSVGFMRHLYSLNPKIKENNFDSMWKIMKSDVEYLKAVDELLAKGFIYRLYEGKDAKSIPAYLDISSMSSPFTKAYDYNHTINYRLSFKDWIEFNFKIKYDKKYGFILERTKMDFDTDSGDWE